MITVVVGRMIIVFLQKHQQRTGIIIEESRNLLVARTFSLVNKDSTILNREYCKAHHQRHKPSRQVETTGGARVSIQDHLASTSDYCLIH